MFYLSNWRFKSIIIKLGKEAKTNDKAAYELSALRNILQFVNTAPSFQTWKFPFLKINQIYLVSFSMSIYKFLAQFY